MSEGIETFRIEGRGPGVEGREDWSIPGNEPAMIVVEDADGTPLTGQQQFGKTIPIQIAPDGAADEAHFFEKGAVLLIELPACSAMTIDPRGGGLWISAGD